jgi:rhodanese-related sulfurtransferase
MPRDIEIDARELADLIGGRPEVRPVLLDVRQPSEHATAALEGSVLVPLDQLAERIDELDRSHPIVVYCHHGIRSLNAAMFLKANGFASVRSLAGGIDRWSLTIDPSVPRY